MAGSALHAGQAAPGASEAARLSFLLRAGAPAFLIQLFGEKSARCCLPKAPGKVLNYSPGPADSETFLPGTAGFGWGAEVLLGWEPGWDRPRTARTGPVLSGSWTGPREGGPCGTGLSRPCAGGGTRGSRQPETRQRCCPGGWWWPEGQFRRSGDTSYKQHINSMTESVNSDNGLGLIITSSSSRDRKLG